MMKQLLISQFTKFVPNCKELIEGKILINYVNKKIQSQAEYIESTCGCKKYAKDEREIDEKSETFFDNLLGANIDEFDEIHALEITLLPNDIKPTLYGVKDGKKGRKTYNF